MSRCRCCFDASSLVVVAFVVAAAHFDRILFARLFFNFVLLSVLRRHLGHKQKAERALAHFRGAEKEGETETGASSLFLLFLLDEN